MKFTNETKLFSQPNAVIAAGRPKKLSCSQQQSTTDALMSLRGNET